MRCDAIDGKGFYIRVRFQFELLLAWSRPFRIIRNEFLSKLNQSFGSRLIVVAPARAASHQDGMGWDGMGEIVI